MLDEVLAALRPQDGETHVDGTFGAGGYSAAILAAGGRVIGIDRDPDAVALGRRLAAREPRFTMAEGRFGDLAAILDRVGRERVDGVVLDLGVSSMQLDQAERGFSFRADGPLDMRMGRAGPTAADLVNTADERRLADLLFRYGDERESRRIARAITRRRAERPFARTGELAEVIRQTLGPKARAAKIDPATRSFQALRIEVNDELGELERALDAARDRLLPNGRLVVVTFHSLEDRVVKTFLNEHGRPEPRPSRHLPASLPPRQPPFRPLFRKPLAPSEAERARNPRARSAKLRAAVRLAEPATEATP